MLRVRCCSFPVAMHWVAKIRVFAPMKSSVFGQNVIFFSRDPVLTLIMEHGDLNRLYQDRASYSMQASIQGALSLFGR